LLDDLPSEKWVPPSVEGHIFTDEVMCQLAYSKSEETQEWQHASYDTFFFHREEMKLQNSVEDALILVKRMSNFTRETLRELRENLQTAFKDWSTAKEVLVDLDNVITLANDKVRREMEIKLSKFGEDLRRMTSMYENSCEQVHELQATLKGLLQIESELHRCEEKLTKSEYQKDVYQEQVRELTMTVTELRNKIRKMEVEVNDAKAQANILEFSLAEANMTKKESQDKVLQLTKKITELTESIASWQGAYEDVLAKEAERRSLMRSVNLQCQPPSASMAIQTEFLTQPIGLRTVVADNLNKLGVTRYPLPMVISQPQQTNNSMNTNNSISSSNSIFTAPEARGFSRGGMRPSETSYQQNSNTLNNTSSHSHATNGLLSARSYSSLNSAVSSLSNVSFFHGSGSNDNFALGLTYPNPTHLHSHGTEEAEEDDSMDITFEDRSLRDRDIKRGSSQHVHLKGTRAHRTASTATNTADSLSTADSVSLPRLSRGLASPSILSSTRSTPSVTGRRSDAGNAINTINGNNAFAPNAVRMRTADKPHRHNTSSTNSYTDSGIGFLDGSSVSGSARNGQRSRSPKPIALSIAALRRAQEDMVPLL